MSEIMYSTEDAAYKLDVTIRGIEGWRLKGLLIPVKIAGRCHYTDNELKRFLGLSNNAALEHMHSPDGVAEILSVKKYRVEQWRKEGKLTAIKAGKLWRYPESTLNRFLGLSDDHTRTWANENIDEDGNARGELAEAQKLPNTDGLAEDPELALAG